ncbi:hypothetical protein BU198_23435 [Streptomyces sp. CBMA156]|nr:hypothetical protein [Streptomyces sp. CBMA156]
MLTKIARLRGGSVPSLPLAAFFDAREQPDSLARIFGDYQSWLTAQPWFRFETAPPDQINRDNTRRPTAQDQIT